MDNYAIADNFSLLSKLMDIHGDNSFKAKSYSIAAFNIEKMPVQLATEAPEKIFALKGIGESVGSKIIEQVQTGELKVLTEYIAKTPAGILEMLQHIKGIGPKKIATIWKEMEVETVGELLYACNENRLTLFKGFGAKTQQGVKESIEFYLGTMGSYLYQQIEGYAIGFSGKLQQIFPNYQFQIVGAFRRQCEIIERLEWVTILPLVKVKSFFTHNGYAIISEEADSITVKGKENVVLCFYCSSTEHFYSNIFKYSCSPEFLEAWNSHTHWVPEENYASEEAIFKAYHIPYIRPALRDDVHSIQDKGASMIPIAAGDIKGIIHSHSTWSDGVQTIEEMAKTAIEKGLEYLVISDHSKTAAYAQGLQAERVLSQHQQIDELNKQFSPFRIYKSIESDILGDGSLDYEEDILKTFDLVIASIHSNLKITEEKAMMRLMNAIENSYTSILGHLTGRLLLSRSGYPIQHDKIIDACAANNVVIELNAHPRRLDMDWRFINKALDKGVLISINPDAHHTSGFDDTRYGVLVAQKTRLTKAQNLSSFSLAQFEAFVEKQQQKRP